MGPLMLHLRGHCIAVWVDHNSAPGIVANSLLCAVPNYDANGTMFGLGGNPTEGCKLSISGAEGIHS